MKMKSIIFLIGLLVIVRGQKGVADERKEIEEQFKLLKDLHDNFVQQINAALRMHPVISSMNKALEDSQNLIDSAGCWYPMDKKINNFARDLMEEMPHQLESNIFSMNNKLRSGSLKLNEVKELLKATNEVLDTSLREFMKKDRTHKFTKDVLLQVTTCLLKNQPLDWLNQHYGQLVESVLL